jgi:hypothetical protein
MMIASMNTLVLRVDHKLRVGQHSKNTIDKSMSPWSKDSRGTSVSMRQVQSGAMNGARLKVLFQSVHHCTAPEMKLTAPDR